MGLAERLGQYSVSVADRARTQPAFGLVCVTVAAPATVRHQRRVPRLDIERVETLQGAGADVRDDVVLDQLLITLSCHRPDYLGELPMLKARTHMLGDRELRWVYMIAFGGLGEESSQFGLCCALWPLE